MDDNHEQRIVAFHEAGHAVVGSELGATLGALTLDGLQNRDSSVSWDGNAHVNTCSLPPSHVAKIALAGPLAEIKYCGYTDLGVAIEIPTTLEPDFIPSLVEAMANVANDVANDSDPETMYVLPTIALGDQRFNFRVFLGNGFGDFVIARRKVDGIESVASQTLEMINDPTLWCTVARLAAELIRIPKRTVYRKKLSKEHVTHFIQNEFAQQSGGNGI